jgi:hypothetical protein
MRLVVLLSLAWIISGNAHAQQRKPFVILRGSTANLHHVSQPCSREGLHGVAGTWYPRKSDIQLLELHLADISRLQNQDGSRDIRIDQPGNYYRQYLPILVGKRRLIYVNAFSPTPHPTPPASWDTGFINMCDRGAKDWSVVYDPTTKRFSTLTTSAALPVPPPPPESRRDTGTAPQ